MRSTSISAFSVPRTNRHTITATLHRSISILENGDPHRFSNSIVRVCTRTFACPFVLKRDINNAAGYYEMQTRRRLFARRILSLARHLTTIGLSRTTREERERERENRQYTRFVYGFVYRTKETENRKCFTAISGGRLSPLSTGCSTPRAVLSNAKKENEISRLRGTTREILLSKIASLYEMPGLAQPARL